MAIALHVGEESFEVGTASFFKSFFSTIVVRLEQGNWASRYPVIMTNLYSGKLLPERCEEALDELRSLREALDALPPSAMVWDFEELNAQPPWGTNISPTITSLTSYFVTSSGRQLLAVLEAAVAEARARRLPVTVQ